MSDTGYFLFSSFPSILPRSGILGFAALYFESFLNNRNQSWPCQAFLARSDRFRFLSDRIVLWSLRRTFFISSGSPALLSNSHSSSQKGDGVFGFGIYSWNDSILSIEQGSESLEYFGGIDPFEFLRGGYERGRKILRSRKERSFLKDGFLFHFASRTGGKCWNRNC